MSHCGINPYEAEREARVRENQAKLNAIGIVQLPKQPKAQRQKRTRLQVPARELSLRTRTAKVSYKESPLWKAKRNMPSPRDSSQDTNYATMSLSDYLKADVHWPCGTQALDEQLEKIVSILEGTHEPDSNFIMLTPEDLRTWDWDSLSKCLKERGFDCGGLNRFKMWKDKSAGSAKPKART